MLLKFIIFLLRNHINELKDITFVNEMRINDIKVIVFVMGMYRNYIWILRSSTTEHHKLGAYIYFICSHHLFYGNT